MIIEEMVFCMSAIVESWQVEEHAWYTNITSLQFQYIIHLLADVLLELNKLNRKFHFELVDITSIASTIDVIINLLRRHYLGVSFDITTKQLEFFCATWCQLERSCMLIGLVVRKCILCTMTLCMGVM